MTFYIGHPSSKQWRRITLSALLVFVVAGLVLTGRVSGAETDECISKPNSPATQGNHWYYRTDRVNNRQCWYLAEEGAKARPSERQSGTAVPLPPPKPVQQPPLENRDALALVEPAVSETAEKSRRVAVASVEWPTLPSSAFSTGDRALQRNADEYTAASSDDLPLKPTTADRANQPRAGEPMRHAIGFGALIAVLALALTTAIVVYRSVRLTTARSKLAVSQAASSEPAGNRVPHFFGAAVAATNFQADTVQNWVTGRVDQDSDIEASVRRLLQELQQRYRELYGRDFEPAPESSATPSYGL
jgi:hypothetical protein